MDTTSNGEGGRQRDVVDTEGSRAKPLIMRDDGVQMRLAPPERRQQGQRVEHPAEIGQRRQHKGRDQAIMSSKGLGKHRVPAARPARTAPR